MSTPGSIAILMPAYNPGPDIERTIQSLRQQSVPFKLFLVDDGSKRKPDYRALLAGLDYHLIELAQNVGVNLVRNPALEAILAENFDYVAIMDCDDEMTPDRLAVQQAYLDTHPDIGAVGSWAELYIEQTGRRISIRPPEDHDGIARLYWANNPVPHPSLMIRADAFRKCGFFSAQYEAAEDYDMCWRMIRGGVRFACIPQVLLIKHEDTESISWSKRKVLLRSRQRLQWANLDPLNIYSIRGLLRTTVIRLLPEFVVQAAKSAL